MSDKNVSARELVRRLAEHMRVFADVNEIGTQRLVWFEEAAAKALNAVEEQERIIAVREEALCNIITERQTYEAKVAAMSEFLTDARDELDSIRRWNGDGERKGQDRRLRAAVGKAQSAMGEIERLRKELSKGKGSNRAQDQPGVDPVYAAKIDAMSWHCFECNVGFPDPTPDQLPAARCPHCGTDGEGFGSPQWWGCKNTHDGDVIPWAGTWPIEGPP
jgi:rubrerythrin